MRRLEAAEARLKQRDLSRTRSERMHRQLTLGAVLAASGLPDAVETDLELLQGALLVLLDAYRLSPSRARAEWLGRLAQGSSQKVRIEDAVS